MLSARYRFHGHSSLRYVYKNGEAIRSRRMTIKIAGNKHRHASRFAVVVSKKVMKSAVGRNRIRRRLYEILRSKAVPNQLVHDLVIIVSSAEIAFMPHDELQAEIEGLLSQSQLYR